MCIYPFRLGAARAPSDVVAVSRGSFSTYVAAEETLTIFSLRRKKTCYSLGCGRRSGGNVRTHRWRRLFADEIGM